MKGKKGVYLKRILLFIIIGMIIFFLLVCGKKEIKNEILKISKIL